MIVVVGQPFLVEAESGTNLYGAAARIAATAASRGRRVQLVGTAGEDEAGDEMVLALDRARVGHVALLRKAGQKTPTMSIEAATGPSGAFDRADEPAERALDGAPILDAADVDLALRYLTDIDVLVLADPASAETVAVVAQAAKWADARLVVVAGDPVAADALPDDTTVFEAPHADPDGSFAQFVGSFAAALDRGDEPAEAFRASVASEGWTPSETTPSAG